LKTTEGQTLLGTGVTELNLSMEGKISSSNKRINRDQSGYAKVDLNSNKNYPAIPSGPTDQTPRRSDRLRKYYTY